MKNKKSNRISVLLVALLIVFAVGTAALFAISLPVAHAAPGDKESDVDTQGTWLDNPGAKPGERGTGLAIGRNMVSTLPSAHNGQSFMPNVANYNGLHLFTQGAATTGMEFRAEYLTMTGGTSGGKLKANFRMDSNESSANSGLYMAIQHGDFQVDALIEFNIIGLGSGGTVNTKFTWSQDGTSESMTNNIDTAVSANEASKPVILLSNINGKNLTERASLNFELTVPNGQKVRVSDIVVTLNVVMNVDDLVASEVTYSVSGQNRKTAEGTIINGIAPELYVKPGDVITLYTNVTYTENKGQDNEYTRPYEFPSFYKNVFTGTRNGIPSSSNFVWEATSSGLQRIVSGNDSDGNPYFTATGGDTIFETRPENGGYSYEITDYSALDGRKAVFRVGDAPSAVRISAYLLDKITNGVEEYTQGTQTEIIFKVDKDAPTVPLLGENTDFYRAMAAGEYYTAGWKVTLKLTDDYGTQGNGAANEYVYAYILVGNIGNTEFLNGTVDYTPGNGKEYDFIYTLSQGGTAQGRRVEIITYNSPEDTRATTNPVDFSSYGGGEFSLVLIAVDEAGNTSAATLYSSNSQSGLGVRVDGQNYYVRTQYLHGVTASNNESSMSRMAYTYIFPGSQFHDADGRFLLADNEASDGLNNFYRKREMTAKRMDWVTIRILMNDNQRQSWSLVSYTNYGNLGAQFGNAPGEYQLKVPSIRGREHYFDITFQVDENFISEQRNMIYFAFRQVLTLNAMKTSFTFSLNERATLNNHMRAYLNDRLIEDGSLSYDIQYYPLISNLTVSADVFHGNTPKVGEELVLNGITYILTKVRPNGEEYVFTAYRPDQEQPEGFRDAGNYWYIAELSKKGQDLYVGRREGEMVITKASPNVSDLEIASPLVYGQKQDGKIGLDLLQFTSRDMSGRILDPVSDTISFGDKTYFKSYYGLYGEYTVVNPDPESDAYRYPNVTPEEGRMIGVRFTPVNVMTDTDGNPLALGTDAADDYIRENIDFYRMFFKLGDDNHYELIEGAMHAGNFDVQTLSIKLTVLHAEATISMAEGDSPIYDGNRKSPEIITVPADLPFIVYYKEKDALDDAYTTTAPINAGEYKVRFSINRDACNYYSDAVEKDFVIEKKTLDLQPAGSVDISAERYYDNEKDINISFNRAWQFTYGQFSRLTIDAYADESKITVPCEYRFRKVVDANGKTDEKDYTDFVTERDVRGDVVEAGKYLMHIQVNQVNYKGEIVLLLHVSKAVADDGTRYLNINYPGLRPLYDIVELHGGNRPNAGHLEFGQYLPEVQNNFLIFDSTVQATYRVAGYSESRKVAGRYLFEDTARILERNGLSPEFYDGDGRLLLPVRYDDDGRITMYQANLVWEAGETVDGVFVPNENFRTAENMVLIYVVRARANFSEMKFGDLVYGQRLEESEFLNAPVVSGNVPLVRDRDYDLIPTLPGTAVLARGTHQIACTFTPSDAWKRNYLELTPNISLTVTAKPATVTFTGGLIRQFGSVYIAPAVTTAPVTGLEVQFIYTNEQGQRLANMAYDTPVGTYAVTARINNPNYEGETTSEYVVEKGNLQMTLSPTNPLVRYGATLSEVELSTGRCANANYQISVDGTFCFVYDENVTGDTIPDVGETPYRVLFCPYDESWNDSFLPFYYEYTLNVEKAVAQINVGNLSVVYNMAYQEPAASAYDADGTELELIANYGTPENAKPRNAGTYQITYTVAENRHYTGETQVTFQIVKADAALDLRPQTKPYTGEGVDADTFADVENLGYSVTYRNLQNAPTGVPVEVGRYIATITVDHVNYKGTGELYLDIRPASISLTHLNDLSYSTIEPVTAVLRPEYVNYTVMYRARGTEEPFGETMVKNAGEYDVKLIIDHNGYHAELTELDGQPIILYIAKDLAVINVQSVYERAYTSYGQSVAATISPVGIRMIYEYRLAGSNHEYTATQPIEAGSYDVRLTVNDPNYVGVEYTKLNIRKADLQVISAPNTTGQNPFGISKEEVRFSLTNPGEVRFNATNENMTNQGKWVVDEDISGYFVGTHHVRLLFIPNDEKNFNVASTTANLTITQRDIGEFIRFEQADLKQSYTQKEITVRAYLAPEFIPPTGYRPIDVIVTYNGSEGKPNAPGLYTLSALINDTNYTAGMDAVRSATLEIIRADLEVIQPNVTSLKVGDRLGDAVLSGGAAHIKGLPSSTVAGRFVIRDVDTIMENANLHNIVVLFMPTRTDLYNYVAFSMAVNVEGRAIHLTGVSATEITYGDPLFTSQLSYVSATDADTGAEIEGELVWENPNEIVDVHGKANYQFRPNGSFMNVYNIIYDSIESTPEETEGKLRVAYGTMVVDRDCIDVHAHVGETMETAVVKVLIYNANYPALKVEGATFTFFDAAQLDPDSPIAEPTGYPATLRFGLKITHPNYREVEIAPVEVRIYQHVAEDEFHVAANSKYYDGQAVTPETLDLHVAETDYQPQNYTLTFYKDGVEVPEILEHGNYTIYITLNDVRYDGYATVPFTVLRRDMSDFMIAVGGSSEETLAANGYNLLTLPESDFLRVYGDTQAVVGVTVDGVENSPQVDLRYYSENGVIYYGAIMPQDAGTYRVTARVTESDLYYEGEKEFTLIILKRRATVQMDTSYQFVFGETVSINPMVSNQIDASQYTFSYKKAGSEEENPMLPVNVGRYTVYVNINHANFYGKESTILTISEAILELEVRPSFGSIKYGQEFSNVQIMGGRVVYGTLGEEMRGRFQIEDDFETPTTVGNVPVTVCFYPENTNYEVLKFVGEVPVLKADASIEITVSTNVYNGQMQPPSVVTQPIAGIPVRFEYFSGNLSVEPRDAGTYRVRATVNSEFYQGSIEFDYNIDRARAIEVVAPVASNVTYGQSIGTGSVLSGGSVIYVADGSPVVGTFTYVEPGLVLGDVGTYTVHYRFIPDNGRNYHEYEGSIDVSVVKATSAIVVIGTEFIYGDPVSRPGFATPAQQGLYVHLTAESETRFREIEDRVVNSGIYQFTAEIEDDNYRGELVFNVTVKRKVVGVYYMDGNNRVERYTSVYGDLLYAKARIVVNDLAGGDVMNAAEIEKWLHYTYGNKEGTKEYYSELPPSAVGEYYVYADLDAPNYTVNRAAATVSYSVGKATVEYLEFDSTSLSNQIYGSLYIPSVTVQPANVGYQIFFPGYESMPTMAGEYAIRVVVKDPNYVATERTSMFVVAPKAITVENIQVSDKAYDGYSAIAIRGELKGVMVGDEVKLTMTARAAGESVDPGTYEVEILSYEITGLHAANYRVREPLFNGTVKIFKRQVIDPDSGSFITTPNGFSQNITVDFDVVDSAQNATNLFSRILGTKSEVHSFNIKENGIVTVLGEKVKVYVKIPEAYRNSENLKVEGMGRLANQMIIFTREGDYVTFYTDSSGEIVFSDSTFPYWIIIIGGAILMLIVGGVLVYFFVPSRKRQRVTRKMQRFMRAERR